MSVQSPDLWKSLDQMFLTQSLPAIVLQLKTMTKLDQGMQELARSSRTMADLHGGNPKPESKRKAMGYALLAGFCFVRLKRFAAAAEILDWLKREASMAEAHRTLENLVTLTFSQPNSRSTTGPVLTSIVNPKEEEVSERIETISTPLFSKLNVDELKAVLYKSKVLRLREKDILFKEGDASKSFFIIAEGEMKVKASHYSDRILKEGDFFGEMGLLSGDPRTGTLTAHSKEVRLIEFSWNDLQETFAIHPKVERRLFQFFAWRLFENLSERHPILSPLTLEERQDFFYLGEPYHRASGEPFPTQTSEGVALILRGETAGKFTSMEPPLVAGVTDILLFPAYALERIQKELPSIFTVMKSSSDEFSFEKIDALFEL